MRPDEAVVLERHSVEPFFKNGYLVICPETRKSVYIDPGDETEELLRKVGAHSFELLAIVNTHAHLDHICGIELLTRRFKVPIYLHPEDEELYYALPEQARNFGLNYPPPPPLNEQLEDSQLLQFGSLTITIHHTPGHSPGSVSLELGQHVFCGDAIFAGSIGRTDLPGGSYPILMQSIHNRILPLGDERILHPGHGPDTTIGRERKTNPYLCKQSPQ